MSGDDVEKTAEKLSGELNHIESFSLQHRIRPSCIATAKFSPNDVHPALVAVTASNKIIVKDTETSLNMDDNINCICIVDFGSGYDCLAIGTESQLIVYDIYRNATLFQKDIPDGVNCILIGRLGKNVPMILCGGNCAVWGFDENGSDLFWTVTGDVVTTMCLCDFDNDGENELIIGSPDFEIRIFKNDLMREELMETESVVLLSCVTQNSFAYALNNGTMGCYQGTTRLWRIKSKHTVISIIPYGPNRLSCVWSNGKIDMRSRDTGEVIISHNPTNTLNISAVTLFPSFPYDKNQHLYVVSVDGKVNCYDFTEKKVVEGEINPEEIRAIGQRKHQLLMELNNFEQEEQLTEQQREEEKRIRIPANTSVRSIITADLSTRILHLHLEASNDCMIRGVVSFAEGLYQGESSIWIPKTLFDAGSQVKIPILPEKDIPIVMYIKIFLGGLESTELHLYEMNHNIQRFMRFAILQEDDKDWNMPTSYVEFDIKQRVQRIVDWAVENLLVPPDTRAIESDILELKFASCAPKKGQDLYIKYRYNEAKMQIYHNSMETTSNIVQSICEYFDISTLESHVVFPEEFERISSICEEMDSMWDLRDRLTADLSEKQSIAKEILIRAEDAFACDDLKLTKQYYTRLVTQDRSVRQSYLLRSNNHSRLMECLQILNKVTEHAAKMRAGEPSARLVAACREAITGDNKPIFLKIIQFGAA